MGANRDALMSMLGDDEEQKKNGLQPLGLMADPKITGRELENVAPDPGEANVLMSAYDKGTGKDLTQTGIRPTVVPGGGSSMPPPGGSAPKDYTRVDTVDVDQYLKDTAPKGGGGDMMQGRAARPDELNRPTWQGMPENQDANQREADSLQAKFGSGTVPGLTPPNGNTGINGGKTGAAVPSLNDVLTSPSKNNLSTVMGVDANKFNDPNKKDFKYDTMRVLSRFDPKQGFTPEVIDALNKELSGTYGTFSSKGGDKLSLTGAKGAKDAADFADQDWIYALKAGNGDTKWNFGGGGAAPPNGGAAGGGGGGMHGAAGLNAGLSGDPYGAIQEALSKLTSSPNLQALLAQLGAV